MKIIDYEFSGSDWQFNKVTFGNINLIVGDSGTGKTRLLNTIFNLGTHVAQSKIGSVGSTWKVTLGIGNDKYEWEVATDVEDNQAIVKSEQLCKNNKIILSRNNNSILYKGKSLVKLPRDAMAISTLKEEDEIKPLFYGFSKIMRRKFFTDVLEKNSGIYAVNQRLLDQIGEKKDLFELYKADLGLNPKLYILQTFFPNIFEKIVTYFKDAFQFIKEVSILDSSKFDLLNVPGRAPIVCIKEISVDKWIRVDELSSGMQKVLLLLTDLFSMPEDSIYLIDEYENSLGVGPIDTLPNILLSEDFNIQLFATSHHPYIISKIPVRNWYIAHRKGSEVTFAYGEELEKRYSVSSQEKYIQLINDPFYSEGIE